MWPHRADPGDWVYRGSLQDVTDFNESVGWGTRWEELETVQRASVT